MADLSIRYLLYGEDKTASKSIKGVGTQAQHTGVTVAGGLSKIGSAIGGEVGEMVTRVSEGFDKIGEHTKGLGAKAAAGGAALAGIGIAMQTMASGDVEAQNQLQAAVEATGKSYAGFGEDVDKVIEKQIAFGHTDGEVKTALRLLTQAYGDPKKALAEMGVTTDLAAAKHISLSAAAGLVSKAHGGAGKIFREFGVTIGKNKDGTKNYDGALTALSGKLKGQASASMDSFGGKVKQAKAWLDNQASSISEKYGPAITMAGGVVTALGTVTQILATRQAAAAVATDVATVATTRQSFASKIAAAGQWLLNAALTANPIGLVVVAIGLLVGALIYAYNHSKTFRDIVNSAWHDVAAGASFMWNNVLKPVFAFIVNAWMNLAGAIIHGAANAFGWVPGLGPKLQAAARQFDKFRDNVTRSINGVKGKTVTVGVNFSGGGYKTSVSPLTAAGRAATPIFGRTGGAVKGGLKGVDSVPYMLMPEEFIVRSDGSNLTDAMRHFGVPGMAGGGLVPRAGLPSPKGINAAMGQGFGAFTKHLNFSNLFASLGGGGGGSGGGAGAWASTVLAVLALLHQSASNLGAVLRRIAFESGGNRFAINRTDSNARAGHPSQGLMQTIPSTFNAYAGPFRGLGITNGFANIYAGSNYALHTYGSLAAIDPRNRPIGYDNGGPLMPGLTMAYNGTGKTEWVSPHGAGEPTQPLVVQLLLDGRVLHQSLLQLKRNKGAGLALG